jgi:hypothetical protein
VFAPVVMIAKVCVKPFWTRCHSQSPATEPAVVGAMKPQRAAGTRMPSLIVGPLLVAAARRGCDSRSSGWHPNTRFRSLSACGTLHAESRPTGTADRHGDRGVRHFRVGRCDVRNAQPRTATEPDLQFDFGPDRAEGQGVGSGIRIESDLSLARRALRRLLR